MTNPIIKTKITIPPVRAQTVFRDRLHERLNSYLGADASLLLVSAKAGAGKSSLISQWLQSSKPEAAWFSLDVDDNDPERFIRYMVAALEESGVVTDLDLTSAFDAPTLPDPKVMAALFLERCFDASNDVLLVLDDYHLITHSWVHAFVEAIADGIGQAGVLVLITRSDPPMPLARWRARGQMVEIRDSDL
ncbi:MAG: hypothetical protein PVI04_06410, partial [Anaerolineales bacterium]